MSIKPIWYFSFVEVKYEQSGVYGCSWLTSWWEKGFFYSPCSPCSEHNRVPHTHYLITSKNRFLHISSTRNLQRERKDLLFFFSLPVVPEAMSHSEQLLDSFLAFFSSQGDGYTNIRALRAPEALLLLPSLCWIHLGPEAPLQSDFCVGILFVHRSLVLSCLLRPLLQLLMGAPGWALALITSMSGATGRLCHSHCLCPPQPQPVGQHPLESTWPVLESPAGPSLCPFGKSCPSLRKPALTIQEWKNDGNEPPSSCSIFVFRQ